MEKFRGLSTLRLVQSISTIPNAFPTEMNTCGRMCVHKSGRFVIVSNRGHQSIAVFRVKTKGSKRGELVNIGCIHTVRQYSIVVKGKKNQLIISLIIFRCLIYLSTKARRNSPPFSIRQFWTIFTSCEPRF